MTRRLVGVLLAAPRRSPPDAPSKSLRLAMLEDVYETVAALELVDTALVVDQADPAGAEASGLTWPGTEVHVLPPDDNEGLPAAYRALLALAGTGADEVTVVAPDAPDLPGLLLGKLHRALGSADVAVLPAAAGGLVALAVRCPLAGWLGDEAVLPGLDLDAEDPLGTLRAGARRRTSVAVGPGWHRVRTAADLDRLDPGLEGWDVTRALLAR